MYIGILALQGAFKEHQEMLLKLGIKTKQIKKQEELKDIDALIIPGGESTTISKLMIDYQIFDKVKTLGREGLPIFGTCAGMVLLAREVENSDQPSLGLINIKVRRNAFGRQVESFEEDLEIPVLGKELFRAVFIRAPFVVELGNNVEVLACYNEKIVCVREGYFLAASFHPELTGDTRLHKYFIENCLRSIA